MTVCPVCPHRCQLAEEQTGICGVRKNVHGTVVLSTFGQTAGFAVDPIEKKPLFHFYPASAVLSFGSIGCNLSCSFCQNASTAQSRDFSLLRPIGQPSQVCDRIIDLAKQYNCISVAFTYNEPVISAEFVIEVAEACRNAGMKTVAVSNGYISDRYRSKFFDVMDAANIDLKSFSNEFYRKYCNAALQPVLDTIKFLAGCRCWLEVTTLLIPELNDSEDELRQLSAWLAENCGIDVPLHFSAFHPANRLLDVPPTPAATLLTARSIAKEAGLRYVYTGNAAITDGETTFCSECGTPLVVRNRYRVTGYQMTEQGQCRFCGAIAAGRFSSIFPPERYVS